MRNCCVPNNKAIRRLLLLIWTDHRAMQSPPSFYFSFSNSRRILRHRIVDDKSKEIDEEFSSTGYGTTVAKQDSGEIRRNGHAEGKELEDHEERLGERMRLLFLCP